MPENKIDQHSQQPSGNSGQQSTLYTSDSDLGNSDSDLDKISSNVQEIEEWDVVMTDQRRPQFRSSENYGRRNY